MYDPLLPRSPPPLHPPVRRVVHRCPLRQDVRPGLSSPPWAHSPAPPTAPAAPSGRPHHGRRRPHRLAAAAGITLAAVAAGAARRLRRRRGRPTTPPRATGAPVEAVPVAATTHVRRHRRRRPSSPPCSPRRSRSRRAARCSAGPFTPVRRGRRHGHRARRRGPHPDQRPRRRRRRRRSPCTSTARTARPRCSAASLQRRHRRPAARRRRPASCRRRSPRGDVAVGDPSSPSATPSPSRAARRSPRASSRRSAARSTPSRATSTACSRPTPRSAPATPAARSPTPPARSSASTPPSPRATASDAGLQHRVRDPDRPGPVDRPAVHLVRSGQDPPRTWLGSRVSPAARVIRAAGPSEYLVRGRAAPGTRTVRCRGLGHELTSVGERRFAMPHDLVIRSGRVVDGSGADARTADIAIDDGVITAVGKVDGRGRREVDADGALVTPGLRRHPHPLRRPGHLGHPARPVQLARRHHGRDGQLRRRVRPRPPGRPRPPHRADGGRRGHPRRRPPRGPVVGRGSRSPSTSTTSTPSPATSTSAPRCPHGAMRLHVMGERGANREPATPDDIAAMAELARQAIEAGALGLHHVAHAQPPLQQGRADPVAERRGGRARRHRRGARLDRQGRAAGRQSDFKDVDAEFDLFRTMAQRSGPADLDLRRPGAAAARAVALPARPHERRPRRRDHDARPVRGPRRRPAARLRGHAEPVHARPAVEVRAARPADARARRPPPP